LDIQIGAVAKNLSEMEKDISQITEQKANCGKSIVSCGEVIVLIEKSQNKITKWFDGNSRYADIIHKIEQIVSYIGKHGERDPLGTAEIDPFGAVEIDPLKTAEIDPYRVSE